jgi:hypothetical protein
MGVKPIYPLHVWSSPVPDLKDLRNHHDPLKLHFESVMEELGFYIANKGDPRLKPFVEDRIGEFEEAWAAFKVALDTE